MTATYRFSRVAVAVAIGLTAPLALRAEAAKGAPRDSVAAAPRAASPESAATGAARRGRQPLADTASKRERGKSERPGSTIKRRVPKAKSGAATSPQPSSGGSQYVPDQPWETEFFVQNTLPTRHYVVRFASAVSQ